MEPCVHHWIISPPQGERSDGVCKLCGAQRTFGNSEEAVDWILRGRERTYRDINNDVAMRAQTRRGRRPGVTV